MTDYTKMSNSRLSMAAAELLGWSFDLEPSILGVRIDDIIAISPDGEKYWGHYPKLASDLNEVHAVISAAPEDWKQKYWWSLCEEVGTNTYEPEIRPWLVYDASARQRTIALLKTGPPPTI